jgi:hypothetical protein
MNEARHGRGTAWARHGRGMGAAWARHGRGMGAAWARHGRGMECVNKPIVGKEGILQTVRMEEITKLLPLYYQYIYLCHLAVKIIFYLNSITIAPFRQYGSSQNTTIALPSYFSPYTFVIFTKFGYHYVRTPKHTTSYKTRLFSVLYVRLSTISEWMINYFFSLSTRQPEAYISFCLFGQ